MKFQLTGSDAGITNLPAKLYVAQQDTVDPTAVNEAVSTAAADREHLPLRSDRQAVRVQPLQQGAEQRHLVHALDLGDGSNNIVAFKLK